MNDPTLISTDLDEAARRLRAGGIVAIPTETVYGLAADAEQPDAVGRIFDIKGRPRDHPLIVHLDDADRLADGWTSVITPSIAALATACWPGPLTMLVQRGPRALDAVTGGRNTVGVRVPAHQITRELLRRADVAVAAPSANRFGRVSPTTAQHVLSDLGDHLDPARDLILDGGPSTVGVESTIVDLTTTPPQILRAGAITVEEIADLLDHQVDAGASGPSRAAGMLSSHYSPDCTVWVAPDAATAIRWQASGAAEGYHCRVLDRTADLAAAARLLYHDLREADLDGLDVLIAVAPPARGLGLAIADRLAKAAATPGGPRPPAPTILP